MKTIFFEITLIITSLLFVVSAWGACPDGKSEIQLITPSGRVKFMCVPDAALPGLDNAADHSDGTIVPTGCPCWDEADIEYLLKNYLLDGCTKGDPAQCYYGKDMLSLEISWVSNYCRNFITEYAWEKLDSEQYKACEVLISPFYD